MIAGIGIDVAEVDRIREAIERHGRRFIDRIYTPAEIAYNGTPRVLRPKRPV